jgi:hypothetical protein
MKQQYNLIEYLCGFIFPIFMVAMTWVVIPGGVLTLMIEYPGVSALIFITMIGLCISMFPSMAGIDFSS